MALTHSLPSLFKQGFWLIKNARRMDEAEGIVTWPFMNALQGIKVVELATVLAGPSVGMFLAELGAEVVKVEPPNGGDVTRSWKLPSEDPASPVSAYFAAANAGKTHRTLNWKTDQDQAALSTLLQAADIVLTNFRDFDRCPAFMAPETLQQTNPRLIFCQLDGYESQPGRPAYDVVLQAETGYLSMNGHPDTGPVKLPLAFMDLLAAHQMKQAILLALYEREKTGKGSVVRCSLERSALAGLANQATNYLMAGHVAQPSASLHPNIAPYGETFECKEGGLIVLAVGSDVQFQRLCILLELAELPTDPRFLTNANRVTNRGALAALMKNTWVNKTAAEWSALCMDTGVPAGVVRSMDQVFTGPFAESMLWKETIDGVVTVRPSTLGFKSE